MVYDCFIFYDELDLLEIRLNLLDEVVDYFVIVESNYTFSGHKKPYNFQVSKMRFQRWANRIIYIPIEQSLLDIKFETNITTYSSKDGAWEIEHFQRNALSRISHLIDNDDCVLLSDVDEIPNPHVLRNAIAKKEPQVFLMMFHYYFLNCQNTGYESIWKGTVLSSGKYFKKNSPQLIRDHRDTYIAIENSGWHFSYLGGVEKIKNKIKSFAHRELNKKEFTQDDNIRNAIIYGKDLFNREGVTFQLNSPFFYPWILQKIMARYSDFVLYPKQWKIYNKIAFKIIINYFKMIRKFKL